MTHEPECDAATLSIKGHEFNLPCICEVARAAYQRGRDNAAEAVFHVIDEEHPRGIDWAPTRMEATLIAAARGGEQA